VATHDELRPSADEAQEPRSLVPDGVRIDEEVVVDRDPVAVLVTLADDPTTVLCVASHDHLAPAAAIRDSVGSKVIERARRPLLVVGPDADESRGGTDVVLALDGRHDPAPLVAVAALWSDLLAAPLRVVTVYAPVLPDVRNPEHFTRVHGPSSDPEAYLRGVTSGLDDGGRRPVELVAISDSVSIAVGLGEHLEARPAFVVVAGGPRTAHHPWPGVVRELVRRVHEPVLVVPGPPPQPGWREDAAAAGIDVGGAG
ncbi:MAG: hypothetical protein JO248_07080, partial [Acidimicrobiia bacterium]|nr:hypothetical protein [Acidimicrobiia bacterium]